MAADALLGAVAAFGRRANRVGDRGCGLPSGEPFFDSSLMLLPFETSLDTLGLLSRVGFVIADVSEARGCLFCVGDFWVPIVLFSAESLITLPFLR